MVSFHLTNPLPRAAEGELALQSQNIFKQNGDYKRDMSCRKMHNPTPNSQNGSQKKCMTDRQCGELIFRYWKQKEDTYIRRSSRGSATRTRPLILAQLAIYLLLKRARTEKQQQEKNIINIAELSKLSFPLVYCCNEVSFLRNCGPVSVGEYNRVIWYHQPSL